MPTVEANGIDIHYDERGSGEPLLLVMGLGAQMIAWRDGFVELLADQGFRVIRFDNRDVGLSTHLHDQRPPAILRAALGHVLRKPPGSPYAIDEMTNDAIGLLDALGIDRAHVVGASMGGMIGQLLALDHAPRVRSLTSIMSTTGNDRVGRPTRAVIAHLIKHVNMNTPERALEGSVAMFRLITGPLFDEADHRRYLEVALERSFDPGGMARQAAAIATAPDRTDRLRSLDLPTLVIHGERDLLITPSGGQATAEAVPGAELLMFPDMGHALPEPLWATIIDSITSNAKQAATA
jgi:pimeloyl-ACP methyl ester carboxylesterase